MFNYLKNKHIKHPFIDGMGSLGSPMKKALATAMSRNEFLALLVLFVQVRG